VVQTIILHLTMRSEAAGIADSLDNNIRLQDYATETDIETSNPPR